MKNSTIKTRTNKIFFKPLNNYNNNNSLKYSSPLLKNICNLELKKALNLRTETRNPLFFSVLKKNTYAFNKFGNNSNFSTEASDKELASNIKNLLIFSGWLFNMIVSLYIYDNASNIFLIIEKMDFFS
jgi:hypothetical protein